MAALRKVLTFGGLSLVLAAPCGAQIGQDAAPPLDDLIEAFVTRNYRAPLYLVGECPEDSPYGENLLLRLLALPQTRRLVVDLSVPWGRALQNCDDPRFGEWFRAQFSRVQDVNAAIPLLSSIMRHPTPENVQTVKRVAFDTSRNDDLRSTILYFLHYGWTEEQKIDLFIEAYRQPGRMPQPYASVTQQNLISGPQGEQFLARIIEEVFRNPGQPDAASILLNLSGDVHWGVARERKAMRPVVIRALDRAAQNRDGRLPTALAAAARQSLAELRERQGP